MIEVAVTAKDGIDAPRDPLGDRVVVRLKPPRCKRTEPVTRYVGVDEHGRLLRGDDVARGSEPRDAHAPAHLLWRVAPMSVRGEARKREIVESAQCAHKSS